LLANGALDASLNATTANNDGNAYVADTFAPNEYPLLVVFLASPWTTSTYENYDDMPTLIIFEPEPEPETEGTPDILTPLYKKVMQHVDTQQMSQNNHLIRNILNFNCSDNFMTGQMAKRTYQHSGSEYLRIKKMIAIRKTNYT
jgi:hypothetical protein